MSFTAALKNQGYASFIVARLVSEAGDSIHQIAMLWLVYEVTGDPVLLSLAAVAAVIPHVLLSLPGGALVDSWNKKRVMIVSEMIRGGAVLAIPLYGDGPLLVQVVIAVGIVEGVSEAFFKPAQQAILPNLVASDNLDSANALSNMIGRTSQMFLIVGGAVVAVAGSFLAFYANAATFFASAVVLLFIPTAAGKSVDEETEDGETDARSSYVEQGHEKLADIRAGISFISSREILLSILVIDLVLNVAFTPLAVVLPVLTETVLHQESFTFGLIFGTLMAGRLFGGLVTRYFEDDIGDVRGQVIVGTLILGGVAFSGVGLLPRLPFTPIVGILVAMFLFGTLFGVGQISTNTLLYRVIPEDKRGIVFAVLIAMGNVTAPLSIAAAGPILEFVNPLDLLVAQSVLILVVGAWALSTELYGFHDALASDQ